MAFKTASLPTQGRPESKGSKYIGRKVLEERNKSTVASTSLQYYYQPAESNYNSTDSTCFIVTLLN